MGLLKIWLEYKNKISSKKNDEVDQKVNFLKSVCHDIESIYGDKTSYIDSYVYDEVKQKWSSAYQIEYCSKKYRRAKRYEELNAYDELFKREYANLNNKISQHNRGVAENRIQSMPKDISITEGRALDKQQLMCVVKELSNQLIIAGAGTGKTTTIIGKIKYLLYTNQYKKEDILVLSYTNAAAREMSQRIYNEIGEAIEAVTFHKLGINIITSVEGVKPKLTNIGLKKFIHEQLHEYRKSDRYLKLLWRYCMHKDFEKKTEFDFSNKLEYEEYLKLNPPLTLKKEKVKSYGELEIANFLLENGIEYKYEESYKVDTRTSEYSQYNPDFYLPEYDIYIEYYGINRKGEVPTYFSSKNGKSAKEAYQEGMDWKRSIHKLNETKLVECFAYEKLEGTLLTQLKERLISLNVEFKPRDTKELWEKYCINEKTMFEELSEQFQTIINLIKSNNYTMLDVRNKDKEHYGNKNRVVIELICPIYDAYEKYLRENGEIDFNDMINRATQYVKQGKYVHPYRYVIVDEYQDISKARYSLLNEMRKRKQFSLFCVGDDWQSIYRFTGSDVNFILDFEKYWGAAEVDRIETTYRFPKSIIDVSSNFIMKNPKQCRKSIQTPVKEENFSVKEIQGFKEELAIRFLKKTLDKLPQNATVFFLGRYNSDIRVLAYDSDFKCKYDTSTEQTVIRYAQRNDLQIQFMSCHKSKGLQADYVVLINNKKSTYGFPSKIQDSEIVNLLLETSDTFTHSEERRLFYVALTRAQKKVYLLTIKGEESEFILELKKEYKEQLKEEFVNQKNRIEGSCPKCGGMLFLREGKYGAFIGCSNYRELGCKFTKKYNQV